MKKLIDLSDNVIKILADEAKENARSVKAHLEYILIQESNSIQIAKHLVEKHNAKRL